MSKISRGKGTTKLATGNTFEIDQKVQNSFKEKTWDETVTKDSWMVFKIMAEFVDGYEKMAKIGPCVSLFGSARLQEDDDRYKLAVEIAENDGELEIAVDKAIGEKCERCWIISETVGTDSEHPHLCKRCCSILK